MLKLPVLWGFCRYASSQAGFAPIFVVVLIVVGIFGGTYLVQNRTNFLPLARVEDQDPVNAVSVKCTNEDGNGRFLTIDSNGCGEVTNIPQRCSEEPADGYKLTFKAPTKQDNQWVTTKADGSQINEETIKSKLNGDMRMGSTASIRSQNVEKVVQKELINCNLFVNYSDDTDCDVEKLSVERDGKKMERMLEGETYTITVKKGANTNRSLPRDARGGVGCRVEMKIASNDSSFSRQEAKEERVSLQGEDVEDEFGIFKTLSATQQEGDQTTDEDDIDLEAAQAETERKAQELLFQKCGFTKNENGIPVYAIALGENQNINDPECKELIAKQTEYFGNKMEKAKQQAEELAAQNKLKYELGVFVPQDDLSEEEKAEALKKAEELNKTVAPAIKQAEAAQKECDGKEGQEKANCLKNVQDPVQKVMDETQIALAKGTLDKLNQILNGDRPGGCVKADLNLTPHLEAKRLKARGVDAANPKGRRTIHRLLVCAGKDKADWKYRVLVGGESGAEFSNDGEDKGNDAERLYGLYGTDESYDGPPQFGSGFPINRCVTLTGNTPEIIKKDLAIYIAAAESGQAPTAPGGGPCKAPSAPDAEGGSSSGGSSGGGDDADDDGDSSAGGNTGDSGDDAAGDVDSGGDDSDGVDDSGEDDSDGDDNSGGDDDSGDDDSEGADEGDNEPKPPPNPCPGRVCF